MAALERAQNIVNLEWKLRDEKRATFLQYINKNFSPKVNFYDDDPTNGSDGDIHGLTLMTKRINEQVKSLGSIIVDLKEKENFQKELHSSMEQSIQHQSVLLKEILQNMKDLVHDKKTKMGYRLYYENPREVRKPSQALSGNSFSEDASTSSNQETKLEQQLKRLLESADTQSPSPPSPFTPMVTAESSRGSTSSNYQTAQQHTSGRQSMADTIVETSFSSPTVSPSPTSSDLAQFSYYSPRFRRSTYSGSYPSSEQELLPTRQRFTSTPSLLSPNLSSESRTPGTPTLSARAPSWRRYRK